MIDFRYHIVSLIAVFLALALGIVVGTTQLNGTVLSDLRNQVKSLKSDKHSLQDDNRALQGRIGADDGFARAVEPALVGGVLTGTKVLVVTAPGSDGNVVSGVEKTLQDAGAAVTAQVDLTGDYLDPRRAADIKDYATSAIPAGFKLPATDDAGVLAGSLLADILMSRQGQREPTDSERQQVLAGLETLSVLHVQHTDIGPASFAVIVGTGDPGGDNPQAASRSLANLAAALDGRGGGVVVAGDASAANDNGMIGAIRSDAKLAAVVSTVDNANGVPGQISTVLAMREEAKGKPGGQYGTAGNATAPAPSLGK